MPSVNASISPLATVTAYAGERDVRKEPANGRDRVAVAERGPRPARAGASAPGVRLPFAFVRVRGGSGDDFGARAAEPRRQFAPPLGKLGRELGVEQGYTLHA